MVILFAIVVIDLIGFGLVIPLLPFYGERFGASPFAVTVILAMYSLAQLFAAPLWGRLSDRWGRRPILLASLAGSVVAYLWMGVAYSLWVLFAARFLQGAIADKLGRPDLRGLILLSFLVILAFAGMEVTFAMWAFRQFHWGPLQVGLVFTFVGVISATMQGGLVGRLAKRYGEARLLTTGLAAILLGLLILPAAAGVPLLLASTGLLAVGMGLTQPSLNSLISRRARADEQGEVLGVNQSAGSIY